jgi:beta-glucosidase-like glycosyl hydrolase
MRIRRATPLFLLLSLSVLPLWGCSSDSSSITPAVTAYCRDHDAREVEARITEVLAGLTLEEKANLMRGSFPLPRQGAWQAAMLPAKGFPGFRMLDGPRGVSRLGGATGTAFPVGMARGATWDPGLEAEVGEAIALELRARGADTLLAPTVNLLQHPLWGRAQETYGEDSFHVGAMGTAFVQGAQEHALCVVKHFAVNNIENTRLTVNVTVDERALREVFLPHFERIVTEANVAGVMTSYNRVNGQYCSQNAHLLRDILRGEWNYAGLVMSDWVWGTHETVPAIEAGLDLEMPAEIIYGEPLADAVDDGDVREAQLDTALRRMLRAQYCYSLDSNPATPDDAAVGTPATLALAQRVAEQSIVLLKNDGALPIERAAGLDIVVVGQLADVANIGDQGSSAVTPVAEVVTAVDGLTAAAGSATVTHVPGDLSVMADRDLVAGADVVIVVVGLDTLSEGEGNIAAGDRSSLALPAAHLALLTEAAGLSDNVVVVLEGARCSTWAPSWTRCRPSSWRGTPACRVATPSRAYSSASTSRAGACPWPGPWTRRTCRPSTRSATRSRRACSTASGTSIARAWRRATLSATASPTPRSCTTPSCWTPWRPPPTERSRLRCACATRATTRPSRRCSSTCARPAPRWSAPCETCVPSRGWRSLQVAPATWSSSSRWRAWPTTTRPLPAGRSSPAATAWTWGETEAT